jgi:hypothetical protein
MKQDEMKEFTKKMNDNLEQFKTEKKDDLKGASKRMDKAEKNWKKSKAFG